jgi:hypothetical protein
MVLVMLDVSEFAYTWEETGYAWLGRRGLV